MHQSLALACGSSPLPLASRNSGLRRSPTDIERMAGAVEVDDPRCVIQGDRFPFPRLEIDFGLDHAVA